MCFINRTGSSIKELTILRQTDRAWALKGKKKGKKSKEGESKERGKGKGKGKKGKVGGPQR